MQLKSGFECDAKLEQKTTIRPSKLIRSAYTRLVDGGSALLFNRTRYIIIIIITIMHWDEMSVRHGRVRRQHTAVHHNAAN